MSWEEFTQINNVKTRFKDVSIEKCILPKDLKQQAELFIEKPHSWILTGGAGRGKTYFSLCLARMVVEKYSISNIRWLKSKHLDDNILNDFHKYGSSSYLIKSMCDIKFLFIDDFGVDRESDRTNRDYYEIIDSRWEDMKPTIISTNLQPEEIERQYGSRIFSRMKDYKWSLFSWGDMRGSV